MSEMLCKDCGKDTIDNDYYLVNDYLWKLFCFDAEFLCIKCLEKRIKRKLNKGDFPNFPVNQEFFEKTSREFEENEESSDSIELKGGNE